MGVLIPVDDLPLEEQYLVYAYIKVHFTPDRLSHSSITPDQLLEWEKVRKMFGYDVKPQMIDVDELDNILKK